MPTKWQDSHFVQPKAALVAKHMDVLSEPKSGGLRLKTLREKAGVLAV